MLNKTTIKRGGSNCAIGSEEAKDEKEREKRKKLALRHFDKLDVPAMVSLS